MLSALRKTIRKWKRSRQESRKGSVMEIGGRTETSTQTK